MVIPSTVIAPAFHLLFCGQSNSNYSSMGIGYGKAINFVN
jgi:hypothetical protein